ncbi:Rv0361 family membrane protein [Mycolicibacterium sp. XJ1819]
MTEPNPDPEPVDRPTALPFLVALAIFGIVVIAIGLLNIFGGDDRPADQQVATAIVGQNDALQRQNYSDFREFTCRSEQRSEAEVMSTQRDSENKKGARFVDDVTEVAIDGDRATAKVTFHFDKAPDDKTEVGMTFVREDGAWKVCSPGPK